MFLALLVSFDIIIFIDCEVDSYDEEWIAKRLRGIQDRHKLTNVWKDGKITEHKEYAILTNEIYK